MAMESVGVVAAWQRMACVGLVFVSVIVGGDGVRASRGGTADAPAQTVGARAAPRGAHVSLAQLPLTFERNDGQADPAVKFMTRGPGHLLLFTESALTWVLHRAAGPANADPDAAAAARDDHARAVTGHSHATHTLRMNLLGASASATMIGSSVQPGKAHYFRGDKRTDWVSNVPTFARVHDNQVYPGVDLVYYGRSGELEYDFIVQPGVDPSIIALGFDGASKLSIDQTGNLTIDTPVGQVVQRKPLVYQERGGVRHEIESAYILTAANRIGFRIGDYDRLQPLIIDPVLVYSTFVGGTGGTSGDQAYGITTDALDNVYITGSTTSTTFPVDGSAVNNDLFVIKLAPTGALAYIAIVGGNKADSGEGLAVDHGGQVVVTGWTDSTNFPIANPIRLDQPSRDALLFKLDPSGQIVYSTYIGGSASFDYGESVSLDTAGNVYVTGATQSTDFPVLNALKPVRQGQDAFVLKVDPTGTLLYGTFLGGSGAEVAEGIVVDAAGSFYVTGWTTSSDFPRVQSTQLKQGGEDVFVSQFAPDGATLVYSRYLGGGSHERPYAIVLDGAGGVYVGGRTDSSNFPRLRQLQIDQPGSDGFLTRLDAGGLLSFSTYLGGNAWERVLGLSVRDGHLFATGQTFSTDFPSVNAVQPGKMGDATTADAFVVDIDIPSSTLLWSTCLGGLGTDEGRGVAALPGANVFVAGWTQSIDFPTIRAIQTFKSNFNNVFISRLAPLAVDGIAPEFVQAVGGDAITVTGQQFTAGTTVLVGGQPATDVSVIDTTTITAVTPALPPGIVDITVVHPDGGSGTLYGALRVLAGTGPIPEAGPNQTVEADSPAGALVTLDGSATFDPDDDSLTYAWSDEGGSLATGSIASVMLPLGTHTITLMVSDGHSAPATDTLTVAIVDTTRPTVTVITPDGANRFYTGTPTTIEWTASDTTSGLGSFDVHVSADGGLTYLPTPICTGISGALRSCVWTSPGPETLKGRIRVTARDNAGNVATDASNANFRVIAGAAYVSVTAPNTAVNWAAGSTQQIKWTHNLGTAAFMRLDLSLDGGATWAVITPAFRNTSSSSASYNWTLPATLSSTARVRVSWNHGPVWDVSNTNFTLGNAYITLTTPKVGATWLYGSTQTQTWQTNLGPLDRVNVLLSTDGGTTFPIVLAQNIVATAKRVTFVTPSLPTATTTARVKVVWANPPAELGGQGTNPGNFRVQP